MALTKVRELLAAVLGFFADGPFARARAAGADAGIAIDYARFARHRAPTALRLHVDPSVIDGDESMTNAFLLVPTLLGVDVLMSVLGVRSDTIGKLLNDVPLVLIEDGKMHEDRMKKARVNEDDILERARELRGVERLDQIKYAVLERSGAITVVPNSVGYV